MDKKKNVTFAFDLQFLDHLDQTKDEAGLATKTDVIRKSVMLYKHLINIQNSGCRFIIKDKDIERELVII